MNLHGTRLARGNLYLTLASVISCFPEIISAPGVRKGSSTKEHSSTESEGTNTTHLKTNSSLVGTMLQEVLSKGRRHPRQMPAQCI